MNDVADRIAACLVADHIELMGECHRLRAELRHAKQEVDCSYGDTPGLIHCSMDKPCAAHRIERQAQRIAELEADAKRYRWLRENMTWCHAWDRPLLATVSSRIWYHATTNEGGTLDEVTQAALRREGM